MDRKKFLRHVAIGGIALVGGGELLRLTSNKPGAADAESLSGMAYGGVAYGGSRPVRRGRS